MSMTDISIVQKYIRMANDGWLQGWHERNGGNLTYRLTKEEVAEMRPFFDAQPREWVAMGVTGENLAGTELEVYKNGSESYFRIAVADPALEATVNATFSVPGFYNVSRAADTNGAEDYSLSYKFTNYLPSKIGKYDVMVYVPQGMEISKVSSPSKYADYKLAELDGMRGAGNAKALAAAAANTLTFTYDAAAGTMINVLIWVICLAIGAFVFIDRYKKATKE